jgi:hypothetical protein
MAADGQKTFDIVSSAIGITTLRFVLGDGTEADFDKDDNRWHIRPPRVTNRVRAQTKDDEPADEPAPFKVGSVVVTLDGWTGVIVTDLTEYVIQGNDEQEDMLAAEHIRHATPEERAAFEAEEARHE